VLYIQRCVDVYVTLDPLYLAQITEFVAQQCDGQPRACNFSLDGTGFFEDPNHFSVNFECIKSMYSSHSYYWWEDYPKICQYHL